MPERTRRDDRPELASIRLPRHCFHRHHASPGVPSRSTIAPASAILSGRSSRRGPEQALRPLLLAPDKLAPPGAELDEDPPVRLARVPPVVALEGREELRERHRPRPV